MPQEVKRKTVEDIEAVQLGNRSWWTEQTMSYDWNDKVSNAKFSSEWFEEVDKRFIFGARLFAHGITPFDRIIPFADLSGKTVLEVGCGMGLHTELMIRAGARVTSIDASPTSVEATRRRLTLKGLSGDVREMDACALDFPSGSFDFVWSWGVIHHSARTATIVKELSRVLKPGGEARVMVYNLEGMAAYTTILRDYVFGFWRGRTLDASLWRRSDGYMARYYSHDMLRDLFLAFFSDVVTASFGQDSDAVPLPRQLRAPVLSILPLEWVRRTANRRGSLLSVTARKGLEQS